MVGETHSASRPPRRWRGGGDLDPPMCTSTGRSGDGRSAGSRRATPTTSAGAGHGRAWDASSSGGSARGTGDVTGVAVTVDGPWTKQRAAGGRHPASGRWTASLTASAGAGLRPAPTGRVRPDGCAPPRAGTVRCGRGPGADRVHREPHGGAPVGQVLEVDAIGWGNGGGPSPGGAGGGSIDARTATGGRSGALCGRCGAGRPWASAATAAGGGSARVGGWCGGCSPGVAGASAGRTTSNSSGGTAGACCVPGSTAGPGLPGGTPSPWPAGRAPAQHRPPGLPGARDSSCGRPDGVGDEVQIAPAPADGQAQDRVSDQW